MMTSEGFDRKYKEEGGMNRLLQMKSTLCSLEIIGKQFGVGKERVRQWMKMFFGSNYDPRKERRKVVIGQMVEYGLTHSKKEFKEMFKNKSIGYRREAIKQIKKTWK